MNHWTRKGLLIVCVVLLVLAALGLWRMMERMRQPQTEVQNNPLQNPPGSADAVLLCQGISLLAHADRVFGVTFAHDGSTVILLEHARIGAWITAPLSAPFAFNEAIASCNVVCPVGSWCRLFLRVDDGEGRWSRWLAVGQWGDPPPWGRGMDEEKVSPRLHIDIVFAAPPSRQAQFRVVLARHRQQLLSPRLSLLGLVVSNTLGTAAADTDPEDSTGFTWKAINLTVPFRSQWWVPAPVSREVCSPTCVAMVLEYYRVYRETLDVAREVYDGDFQLFGNWTYNVRGASQLGAKGYVTRFRRWSQVSRTLEAGRPIIASIRFAAGELQQPPYPSTNGHLLVVRGTTPTGDIVTNDPNIRDATRGDGLLWLREDLERAWFSHGGVGYVLFGPDDTVEPLP